MRRREFLVRASGLLAAGVFPGALSSLLAESGSFRALPGGAGIFTERGGTIAWLVHDDAVVVVDTQGATQAEHCIEGLRGRSDRKIDLVFNTHHHGDHTSGNGTFRPHAAKIVAHRNVPELQKAAAERRGRLDDQVYADTTFETSWRADLGSEVVTARYLGAAHTGGDAVIQFEKANVVHVGDLVFNRMVPYIDRPGGASVQGWIEVVDKIRDEYPEDATYVFGHAGDDSDVVGTRNDLGVMGYYLHGLIDYVGKGIVAGQTVEQLSEVDRIPRFPDHAPRWDGAIRNNVEAAYEELSE